MKRSVLKQIIKEEVQEAFRSYKKYNGGNWTGKMKDGRGRIIGKYRSLNGTMYDLYRDDENYEYIKVNYTSITVKGDGETKSKEEVQKEIDEAKAQKPNEFQRMSDAEFRSYMTSRFK
jgi:hypothetical protein